MENIIRTLEILPGIEGESKMVAGEEKTFIDTSIEINLLKVGWSLYKVSSEAVIKNEVIITVNKSIG